jgi:hypothetical protein
MKKVVILEACDGAGKSYLAKQLHDQYGYEIEKTGPPPSSGDVSALYRHRLRTALARSTRTVFDRLHTGEAIYGPLLRGVDRMGVDGLDSIERIIAENDVALIICCPPWDALVKGWRSKHDLIKTEHQLRMVRDAYFMHAVRLGVRVYDWTASNADEVLKGLIDAHS